MTGQLHDGLTARQFMLGGNATVTLQSAKTGARFTYKVTAAEDRNNEFLPPERWVPLIHFVKVLTGQDNDTDYTFLGTIFADGRFVHGRKSSIGMGAASAVAFAWAWKYINVGVLPESLSVWHEGRCGRCGRKLTVPSSIASGFGPECSNQMGI